MLNKIIKRNKFLGYIKEFTHITNVYFSKVENIYYLFLKLLRLINQNYLEIT